MLKCLLKVMSLAALYKLLYMSFWLHVFMPVIRIFRVINLAQDGEIMYLCGQKVCKSVRNDIKQYN